MVVHEHIHTLLDHMWEVYSTSICYYYCESQIVTAELNLSNPSKVPNNLIQSFHI